MKSKLLGLCLSTAILSGCVLTDLAADMLNDMRDTNRYEDIRDSVELLCDTKNYEAFVDRYGKDTVDKWMKDVCSPVTRKVDPGL